MPRHLWAPLFAAAITAFGPSSVVADEKPPKPGEVREFEIAAGVKMKFCWIPPGKATLGSPASEVDRKAREAEHVYESNGYWLGKYSVTQAEWQAVVGSNRSYYSKQGQRKDRVAGVNTNSLPVDSASYDDCSTFLKLINDRGGSGKVFGKRGKFVLPNEDEWEFAVLSEIALIAIFRPKITSHQ